MWLPLYRSLPRMVQLYPAPNSLHFMSMDKTAVVQKRFFLIFERILFTLRHLQSFVVAFIEQVQNIEKSKASIVEVVSCFFTVKARFKRGNQMYISSQVKSALRKFSEGKDHDCDSFMSDVPVLYKSCVSHLAIWTNLLYLLNLNALTRFFRLQTTN